MALGGTIRGKKTILRLPVETDLEAYNRWMADMRVRRAHNVWHEPAMPATWKERFKEIAKEKQTVLWSIESEGKLIGLAAGHVWGMGNGFDLSQLVIDPDEWRKGYGFDVALALHRYLFDYLDLRRCARITPRRCGSPTASATSSTRAATKPRIATAHMSTRSVC